MSDVQVHVTPEGSTTESPLGQAHEPVRSIDSQTLFDGSKELLIAHKGDAYRLRITRQDKLILTK